MAKKDVSSVPTAMAIPAKFFPKAVKIARGYHVTIRSPSPNKFLGGCAELFVSVQPQPTVEECYRHTMAAIVALIAWMLEESETPPPPLVIHKPVHLKRIQKRFKRKTVIIGPEQEPKFSQVPPRPNC